MMDGFLTVVIGKSKARSLWLNLSRLGAVTFLLLAINFPAIPAIAGEQPTQSVTPVRRSAAAGKPLFEHHCAVCRGVGGTGGRGPALNRVQLAHAQNDKALRALIADMIPPEMPACWFLSEEEVVTVAAYVRSLSNIPSEPLPGDASRGSRIYARSGCGNCHIVAGKGAGYGPELTDIGVRRSAVHLKQAIAKADSTIPAGFLMVEAVGPTGKSIQGIRVNEDTFSIQIKDATGRFYSLRKQELKELRKLPGDTPMPPYAGVLSYAELNDLVAYLASLQGKQ